MIEHSAWIIERAVNGWYQAPSTELKRDNILRRQRNMIRFEDLDPSVAKYDLLTLAVALRALGTGVGTPRAGERTRGCFDLANGYPPFEQIQALTEIELDYNDRSVTDASAATEFAAALKRWSETCPQATRVHLRLATPVVMPTVSLGRKGIAKETDAILHLHAALAALSGEVDCDVTRTYARTAIPTPDEVEPTAGAAG
jgi:hypothetical protein